uniref:Uncharacterized protein n=1 Tax=Brugia malayi TaxID=6279 RepID=A8PSQ7_BRUMA
MDLVEGCIKTAVIKAISNNTLGQDEDGELKGFKCTELNECRKAAEQLLAGTKN